MQFCQQGDRAGLCVTQLDAKLVERGIVCAPGSVPTFSAAIAAVERVRFYSGKLPSSGKVRSAMDVQHVLPNALSICSLSHLTHILTYLSSRISPALRKV